MDYIKLKMLKTNLTESASDMYGCYVQLQAKDDQTDATVTSFFQVHRKPPL